MIESNKIKDIEARNAEAYRIESKDDFDSAIKNAVQRGDYVVQSKLSENKFIVSAETQYGDTIEAEIETERETLDEDVFNTGE